MSRDEELFRQAERDVLDRHVQKFKLLQRPATDAVRAALRVYARILRELHTGEIPKNSNDAKSQTANEGLRGLGHCLRWIDTCCPALIHVPVPSAEQLDGEAFQLLQWGVSYDPLWNQHSAFSAKLVKIDVDEDAKVISFLPPTDVSHDFFCQQVEATKASDERMSPLRPDEVLAKLSQVWFSSARLGDDGLVFNDFSIRESGAIDVARKWLERVFLPELPGTTTLAGCNPG